MSSEAADAVFVKIPSVLRAASGTLTRAVAILAGIPDLGPDIALELCVQHPITASVASGFKQSSGQVAITAHHHSAEARVA